MRQCLFMLAMTVSLAPGLGFAADVPPFSDTASLPDEKIEAHDAEPPAPEYNIVVLQGLNKVTGHVSKLEGPTGTVQRFGTLEIVAHRCWKSDPEERPENAALLEISELNPGEPPQKIFLGWMFSSSPGLSGLEHPVYDINVLSCETAKEPEKTEAPADKPQKDEKPAKTKTKADKKPATANQLPSQ